MKLTVENAIDYLYDVRGVDFVYYTEETPDFIECVCDIGGDAVIYRVYESDGEFILSQK